MHPKLSSALEILRQEGPVSLTQKTSHFVARQTSTGRRVLFHQSKESIRNRMKTEDSLDDILDTVLDVKPGYSPYQIYTLQLRDEIKNLATLVEEERPQNLLEIGTANGGSLYIWSRYLDSVSRLISLDLPGGRFGGGYDEKMAELFREFSPSKNMHFVRANSHTANTYDEVSDLVDDGVDFLFIDGDHTYKGVKQDFEMYSELVSDGGIIALHDIVTHPDEEAVVERRRENVDDIEPRHLLWDESHPDCNVDRFWDEVVAEYNTEEIISHPDQTWAGIGIIRI